jgi:hypothetical protein
VILKSDGEPAVVALKTAAAEAVPGLRAIPKETPPDDHKANGEIENAVKEVKRQVRVMKSSLESKLGFLLKEDDPMLAWIPRHAGDVISRYRKGPDGLTAEKRRTGKNWQKPMLSFGERVLFKEATTAHSRKNDLEDKMIEGRYVGHHSRTSSSLFLTNEGVKKGCGIRRLDPTERWKEEGWSNLKGNPWDVKPRQRSLEKPAIEAEENKALEVMARPSAAIPYVRRLYILKSDIERFGPTPACTACNLIVISGKTTVPHNEECRSRIQELLAREDEGNDRIAAAQRRQQKRQEEVKEAEEFAAGDAGTSTDVPTDVSQPTASATGNSTEKRMRRDAPDTGGSEPSSKRIHREPITRKRQASVSVHEIDPQAQVSLGPTVVSSQASSSQEPMILVPNVLPVEAPTTLASDVEDLVGSLDQQSKCEEINTLSHVLSHNKLVDLTNTLTAVRNKYRREEIDLSEEECFAISCLCLELSAADLIEVYSPPRFTEKALEFNLKPGFAVDLTTKKPGVSEEYWDLSKPSDVEYLSDMITVEDPFIVTGSPPCTAFSKLLHISKARRDPRVVEKQREEGKLHLRNSIRFYRQQMSRDRYFLHEHPWGADSWHEPEMESLINEPNVFLVKGPMCRWGMKAIDRRENPPREGFVRKETGWLTNSPVLAKILEGGVDQCTHRHVHLIGGLAAAAAVYPPKLVSAVLQGIKEQMILDGHLSHLETFASGPVPEEPLVQSGDWTKYWDDVNGVYLNPQLVEEARKEEIAWVRKQGVYDYVPRTQSFERTGKAPIPLRWIDTNKGDDEHPKYRSRLVVREIKAAKAPEDQLPAEQLFSSMPPLECVKILCSTFMSMKNSARGKSLKLATFDISRAHFYGTAEREIYVEITDEEKREVGADMCGILRRSMYGTQDASAIWQKDYVELLSSAGFTRGVASGATFDHKEWDLRVLVHGDDFLCLGDQQAIDDFEALLKTRYEFKKLANIGWQESDDKEVVFLNRVIALKIQGGEKKLVFEADVRHANMIVEQLGLSKANGVDVPTSKLSSEAQYAEFNSAVLSPEQAQLYRSLTMRAAYLAQDRPDIGEATKRLARHMKTPTEGAFQNLKRLARYLKKYPEACLEFKEQKTPNMIKVFVDSDHAGCVVTRRSTTGMIAKLGQHVVKHSSNLQSTVSLSSGESEYYALVKGASIALGLQAILKDWRIEVGAEILSDSSAAKGTVSRRGLGKTRHVQTRYLWIQERLARKEITVTKIQGVNNPADILTKSVSKATLNKHCQSIGLSFKIFSTLQKKVMRG